MRFRELNGLTQLITAPTRVTASTSSTIDLIFCNVTHVTHVHSSGVLDLFISDHQPIYLIKKMNTKQNKSTIEFKGRTYRHYTPILMQDHVDQKVKTHELLEMRDPEMCWNVLYQSLTSIADIITPEKQYVVNKELPAWLTPELINLKKDRDYFFKKAKITGEEGDWFLQEI